MISINFAFVKSTTPGGMGTGVKLAGSISDSNGSPFTLAMNHVDQSFCCWFRDELIADQAARDITFISRRADHFLARQLNRKFCHLPQNRAHPRGVVARVDDIKRFAIEIAPGFSCAMAVITGIFKSRLNRAAKRAGGHDHSGRRENTGRRPIDRPRALRIFSNAAAIIAS